MRKLTVLVALWVLAGIASSPVALAQVSDAERAAARQLFKEGDDLQRAGKFADALDKFQRAQQVFSAPTNMLRIAECEAALGRLVEAAESYRALVRTPLPAGSPPAFQAAVGQAKGELSQVEPRVPRLLIQMDPPSAPSPQLQVDGQAVPAALIGEPFPLDPGQHRVLVTASGYAGGEQTIVLKEHETKTLAVVLRPITGVTYAPGTTAAAAPSSSPPPPPPPPPPAPGETPGAATPTQGPPLVEGMSEGKRKQRGVSLLVGLHLGLEVPAGTIPVTSTSSAPAASLTGDGFAYALDGGVRFAHQFYVGLTVEHASLGANANFAQSYELGAISQQTASTTALGAVIGFIVNPERASLFLDAGIQARWYSLGWLDSAGKKQSAGYNAPELLLGLGVWIPAGRSVRLMPEATVGLGTFSPSGQTSSESDPGHGFLMFGIAGFFNADL